MVNRATFIHRLLAFSFCLSETCVDRLLFMTRISSTPMSLIWKAKNSQVQGLRFFKKLAAPWLGSNKQNARKPGAQAQLSDDNILMMSYESGTGNSNSGISKSWVPDPRTGIYVPRGHESMMDSVPDGAATFDGRQTCWFRHVEGVDKAYPETAADHYLV